MKKLKKILLFIIPTLLVLISLGIVLQKHQDIKEEEKNRYCNETTCYTYYKDILKEYSIEDKNYVLQDSCKDCKDKIIYHTKNKLVIKVKNKILHYYKKNYEIPRKEIEPLKGKAFKNENNEIYFFNDHLIIIASEKGTQRKYGYTIENFDDEYSNVYLFHELAYTYNNETKEIIGFEPIEKDQLKKIDLSYYEEDGTIKVRENVQITGAFTLKNMNNNIELYVYKNKVLYSSFGNITRGIFKVVDANEEELFLSYNNLDEVQFIYNIKDNKLYTADYDRYKSIDKKELEDISFDYFQLDTTLKPINISIDGAYRYTEESSEKEILIKNGEITLAEYYVRDPEHTKLKKYKYNAYTRSDKEITYYYKKDTTTIDLFKYNIKDKSIYIFYDEYKKIKESDLKYIK